MDLNFILIPLTGLLFTAEIFFNYLRKGKLILSRLNCNNIYTVFIFMKNCCKRFINIKIKI